MKKRPDLLETAELTVKERQFVERLREELQETE